MGQYSQTINVVYHINKLNNKNHMIISIDVAKASDTIQHPFIIIKKKFNEVSIEAIDLKIIKAIYDKPTDNIICNV